MKKLFYLVILLFPVVVCAQQSWYKSSPLDYIWVNVGRFFCGIGSSHLSRI